MKRVKIVTLKAPRAKVVMPEFSPLLDGSCRGKQCNRENRKQNNVSFPALPMLSSHAKKSDVNALFREKLKLCLQMCTFDENGPDQFVMAKEDILQEIRTVLRNRAGIVANQLANWNAVMELVSVHLFRKIDPIPDEWFGFLDFYCMSDLSHAMDWVHLGLVYDIAIEWVTHMPVDSKEKLSVACDLIRLCVFVSPTTDDREQEKAATLFVAIYEAVPQVREFAFQIGANKISQIWFGDEPFTSAKTLLRAFTGILAGLSKPLNQKYLPFWEEVLLPLHRCDHLVYFAKELFTCVVQILDKDRRLVVTMLHELFKHWPVISPKKQMIFLDEIAQVMNFVDDKYCEECVHVMAPQLLASLTSCHSAIVEKILYMWEVGDFVWVMTSVPGVTYPMFLPKLLEIGKTYWNPDIRILAASVAYVMQQNDARYFDAVGRNLKKLVSLDLVKSMTRAAKWKYLIFTFEEDRKRQDEQVHLLSTLFSGCDAIDPWNGFLTENT